MKLFGSIVFGILLLSGTASAGKIHAGKVEGSFIRFKGEPKQVTMVHAPFFIADIGPVMAITSAKCNLDVSCGYGYDCYIPMGLLRDMGIDPINLMNTLVAENSFVLECIQNQEQIAERIRLIVGSVK